MCRVPRPLQMVKVPKMSRSSCSRAGMSETLPEREFITTRSCIILLGVRACVVDITILSTSTRIGFNARMVASRQRTRNMRVITTLLHVVPTIRKRVEGISSPINTAEVPARIRRMRLIVTMTSASTLAKLTPSFTI